MADIICPTCGKTNPEELEICQYCGTLLKNRGTEPLAPIRPGDATTTKKTSELERTLPTWLRDIRKGGADQNAADTGAANTAASGMPAQNINRPEPPKPEAQKKKDESPLDLLAGLAQSGEEEEDVPDWLASLKTNLPGGSVPSPEPVAPSAEQPEQPADWLAALQDDSPAPAQPTANEGTATEPASTDNIAQPADSSAAETMDWLSSLQAQDQSKEASAPPAAIEPSPVEDIPSTGSLPDWLNGLTDDSAPQAAVPVSPLPEPPAEAPSLGELSGWLAGLDNETPAAASPAEPAPAGDLPDWLAGLGSDSASPMPPASTVESPPENTAAAFELS